MKIILRVRDTSGRIIPIPAIQGEEGHTPEKGVDYFTEEDKVEMINEVFDMLPALDMVATFDDGSTATYRIYGVVVTE